jgi:hypothetical protein
MLFWKTVAIAILGFTASTYAFPQAKDAGAPPAPPKAKGEPKGMFHPSSTLNSSFV